MEKGFKMKNETEFEFDEILGMGFTTVPNGIFESDLTFNAIGIYCTIIKMKNANGWKVYQSTLVSDKNGRTKVMNGMKELIEKGWIEKVQLRDEKGRLNGVKYIIRSMPTAFLPKSEKPTSGNPTSEKPNSDNVPLQIKTNTNKDTIYHLKRMLDSTDIIILWNGVYTTKHFKAKNGFSKDGLFYLKRYDCLTNQQYETLKDIVNARKERALTEWEIRKLYGAMKNIQRVYNSHNTEDK